MPTILLDSKEYEIVGQVEQFPLSEFSTPFALTTQQRRGDRALQGSWETKNLLGGYGKLRLDADNPRDFLRFTDSEIETRFSEGQMTLPLRKQNTTATGLSDSGAGTPVAAAFPILSHRGKVGFLASYATNNTEPRFWTFAGATDIWTSVSVDGGSVGNLYLYDSYVALGLTFVLYQRESDVSLKTARSSDLASWTVGAVIGTDLDGGRIWSFGATLLALIYDASNASIGVYKSTDNGATWGAVSQTLYSDFGSTAFSNNAPRGIATYFDGDGNEAVVVGLRDGVYSLNLTANTNQLLFPLPVHDDNCNRMLTWNGRLYVPTGDGGLMEYTWTGAEGILRDVGPNRDDGMPSGKTGTFVMLVPSTRWLFGLYGTGTAWTVLAYDGQGWHFIAKFTGTSGFVPSIGLSGEDDDVMRLHIRLNATTLQTIEYPLDNPGNTANVLQYEATGILQLPEFDAGIFEENKGIFEYHLDAVSLGDATQEYIQIQYGLDGGSYTANNLGNIISGTLNLKFGTGGVGVSGKTIKTQFTLNRRAADNTLTPKLRRIVLHHLVVPTVRYGYRSTIDMSKTQTAARGLATIMSDLKTLANTVTLVAFQHDRNVAATNVKLVPPLLFRLLTQTDVRAEPEISKGQFAVYLVELH